jgi:hypothetical protein
MKILAEQSLLKDFAPELERKFFGGRRRLSAL